MPHKTDAVRLRHMLDAARESLEFVLGKTWDDFQQDRLLQLGVLYSITVIGEAGANITADFKAKHPEVTWRDIVGMRNRLVHAYFDVNVALVWKTVQEVMPSFITILEKLLQDEEHGQLSMPD